MNVRCALCTHHRISICPPNQPKKHNVHFFRGSATVYDLNEPLNGPYNRPLPHEEGAPGEKNHLAHGLSEVQRQFFRLRRVGLARERGWGTRCPPSGGGSSGAGWTLTRAARDPDGDPRGPLQQRAMVERAIPSLGPPN